MLFIVLLKTSVSTLLGVKPDSKSALGVLFSN
jgi:hypothetical protein